MIQPKTWAKSEIIDVIETEIRETQEDAASRGVRWNRRDLAEMIFDKLNEKGLICDQP